MASYGVRSGCIWLGHDFYFKTFPNCGAVIGIHLSNETIPQQASFVGYNTHRLTTQTTRTSRPHFKTNTNHWR
jgi:hypothetical protein